MMQRSSTNGLGFLVFRDMTKSIGNAPISLLHFATHILFVAAPLHETNQYHLTQHHPNKKTQNTSLKVSPQKTPQQKTRHTPQKNRSSSHNGETDRSDPQVGFVECRTWHLGWSGDGSHYGSTTVWKQCSLARQGGGGRPFGVAPSPPAKVGPPAKGAFLKGHFRKFSAFNHQFSGDMLVSSEGLHVRKDGDYSIDSIWM